MRKRELEADLLDMVDLNLGRDLPDVNVDEISIATGLRRERGEGGRIARLAQAFVKNMRILILGTYKDVRYPISDRLRILGVILGGSVTIAAAESLLANHLAQKGITSSIELSLRTWVRDLIVTIADSAHAAVLALIDAKIVSLLLGLLLLLYLVGRKVIL